METQEPYILGRTFSANARCGSYFNPVSQHLPGDLTCLDRLNLQYFLWKEGGFSLHPSIPANTKNLRVAEIGVGTGIWLVDLAHCLPDCAKIEGFDINLTQCPPAEWLPSNVSVHQVDCLGPLPEHLIGQYDIVHIQLFHLAVHNNDPAPIIENLIKLLKPGGWISWGEIDYSRWEVVRTMEGRDVVDNLTPLLRHIGTLGGKRPNWAADDWPSRLHLLFAENGLENVARDNRLFPPELLAFQLDTALMASEEVSYKVLDPMDNGSGDQCRALISEVFRNRQKLAYNVGRLTVVGQKPQ
ncbi:hypothetical protein FHL15_005646 [Xylaria flabelliformis]|uniref:Methyltransferase domain-containing protein n=1 Tax=Xylaria flabelliformis TaxID=2512241 RepID=A0A553HZJ9_9PEZI|nr:hypothetical protein FHL15_005646 [Xylaria flabelliformis]